MENHKFIDLNFLSLFLTKLRNEIEYNYINTSNSVTTNDIDTIFDQIKEIGFIKEDNSIEINPLEPGIYTLVYEDENGMPLDNFEPITNKYIS